MERRTEIPAYDCAVFAREIEHATNRRTVMPSSDVGASPTPPTLDLDAVPEWTWTSSESFTLDPEAAFLLLNVDGISSFETVIQLSHVPRGEAIPTLLRMLEGGLIAVRGELARTTPPPARSSTTQPPGESGVWTRDSAAVERWAFIVEDHRKTG